jgi:hypothetical protein
MSTLLAPGKRKRAVSKHECPLADELISSNIADTAKAGKNLFLTSLR